MNFDIGEVLTRAWQITWKNKVLWVINTLPFLTVFLILPFWLVFVFAQDFNPNMISRWVENPIFVIVGSVFYILLIVVGVVLQIVARASATLGIFRVETKNQPIAFMGLLKDGARYFWRVLGTFALITGAMLVLFLVFFACMALFSVATMGLGAICFQPLFLLMVPLSVLVMAFMEQSESAIIADELGVMDAMKRAYELIKANIWKYILITIVIYFGMNILMSILIFPLMIPFFFIMMTSMDAGMDFNNMLQMQAVFGVVFLPVMALVQGFGMTYLKSAMMITYLRFTRPSNEPQLVLQETTI